CAARISRRRRLRRSSRIGVRRVPSTPSGTSRFAALEPLERTCDLHARVNPPRSLVVLACPRGGTHGFGGFGRRSLVGGRERRRSGVGCLRQRDRGARGGRRRIGGGPGWIGSWFG